MKHNLPVIDIFNENGTLNKNAQIYIGEDRFTVRKKITKELSEKGFLAKTEDIINKVGYSERTDAVIEPRLSIQWFCKMKELAQPALENVMNDTIKFHPAKFKNSYRHWMENVKDWCVSRQLWWGQRIPAWYDENGDFVIAKTKDGAIEKFKIQNPKSKIQNLKQDEDVVDTWFSSWLWPISVFDPAIFRGEKPNADLQYYYPTNDLVTAPEIMFFWVARMVIAGYEYMKEPPFKNVYYTGIVRDKIGRKMSKSLGNSPDPIELMKKYGADGVRVGMLLCSPAGNDLPFDEALCEQGRNFANKIWNAFRLVRGWNVDEKIPTSDGNRISAEWFNAKLNSELEDIEKLFEEFKISEALMTIYKLIWDDFCSWYLEMIKPEFVDGVQKSIDKTTYDNTLIFFEKLLKILHPFMPFITEEIWHLIKERNENDCIIISEYPNTDASDKNLMKSFLAFFSSVTAIRSTRNEKNISPKKQLELFIKISDNQASKKLEPLMKKLCNLSSIHYIDKKIENSISFVVEQIEFFIPLSSEVIDVAAEKERLKKELEYNRGFLNSVQKKLANEKFVANAKPEVISAEKKKQADAEVKIKAIEEQLAGMKN